jgi:hypothetical protein
VNEVMSGFVFDVRSVISFVPAELGSRLYWRNVSGTLYDIVVVGYAVVVTGRSMWVVTTDVVAMVFCCDALVPGVEHMLAKHRGAEGHFVVKV